jgi:hypothetical protein
LKDVVRISKPKKILKTQVADS